MVDQYFNAIARQRKAAAIKAEREAAKVAGAPKTIRLDGHIGNKPGEFGATWLRSELPTDGREVRLVIHSEGGSLFECLAMHDILRAYPGKVVGIVASAAFSAASLLLTAADETHATENSFVMLHNSSFDDETMQGLSDSERELLGSLDETMVRLYSQRSGQSSHTIRSMMNEETFLSATEAKRLGFIDRIESPKNLRIVARRLSRTAVAKMKRPSATTRWNAAVDSAAAKMPRAAAIMAVDKSHPGLRLKMLAEVNRR